MKQADVLKRLGRRVNAFRTSRLLTQEQLAERCDFTSKFISEIERGLVNVPVATLARVGAALGVTVATLGVRPLVREDQPRRP